MEKVIVKKFGGSSVASPERVRHVAELIIEEVEAGNKVVVVLSAQGKTTNELIARAKEMSPDREVSRREMDMLISTGEQQSVALMAITLQAMGYPAVSLNAFQVPMTTSRVHQSARLRSVGTERIEEELDRGQIVLITGFQGVNRMGDVTTLGRSGSDTTAVAVAAALNADRCQIYTDVEGVYTADPRIVPNAHKIEQISYEEMLELATGGAQVLHMRSVELAKKYHVEVEVLSSLVKAPGTVVRGGVSVENSVITGVTGVRHQARITVAGVPDTPGREFTIFHLLAKEEINVDLILQSSVQGKAKDISFTVDQEDEQLCLNILKEHQRQIGAADVYSLRDMAKVAIVGAGMVSYPGVAAKMFEALYSEDITIRAISTSDIKITVLIDQEKTDKAINAIHREFDLGQGE